MSNKNILQNHNEIISNNNISIDELIESINNLPEAGGGVVPTETIDITENGTYDVTNYASANVNVVNDEIESLLKRTITSYSSDTLTSVGSNAFQSCSKLTTVSLPNATSLGLSSFNACSALVSIEVPKVTSITTQTFYGCDALETLNLPSVKTTGTQGIRHCDKLTRVDFGAVTNIGAWTLDSCPLLDTLIVRTSSVCTLDNTSALNGTKIASGTGYIYVPDELVEEYRVATNWSSFTNQIRGLSDLDNVLDLSDYSFPITLDEGLEISYNKADMSITFNGTLTDGGGFNIPITQDLIGTYTLSYTPAESDKAFYISIDNKTETMVNGWGATEKTFTLTEQPSQLMFWFDHSSTPERNVYDNYTIKLKLVKQEGGNE